MARFHLTPNEDTHQNAVKKNKAAGLKLSGSNSDQGIHISTYQKRAIQSDNYLETSDGGFIAITGSLIMDGKIGGEVLSDIYKTFVESGLEAVRKQSFGHYTVIICRDDRITIFCDPNGVYELYYTKEDEWFVSNSLYLCGTSLNGQIIDKHGLYQRAIEYTEISDRTIYQNVRRLSGRERIEIDMPSGELSVEQTSIPEKTWAYKDRDLNNVLSEYTDRTERVFEQIVDATDNIGIQATGGLDSRTVLAGILQQELKPLIIYGVGNSKLTNTKNQDLKIAKRYANEYELPFYQMDWSGSYPVSIDTWNELFHKYGFRYHTYGATPSFFSEFADGFPENPELILSGYGFGTFSNNYFWENSNTNPVSFDELVKNMFSNASAFNSESFKCESEYFTALSNECERALEQLGEDIDTSEPIDIDELTRIVQLLNGRPQSAFVNIANEFTYHLSPFATYELGQPMIDFPREHRRGERIRVKLLKNLYPNLANIPIYSGREPKSIQETDELSFEGSVNEKVIKYLSSSLPAWSIDILRPIYQGLFEDNKRPDIENEILETDIDRLETNGFVTDCFDLNNYSGDVRISSRLSHYEYAVYNIGWESVDDNTYFDNS